MSSREDLLLLFHRVKDSTAKPKTSNFITFKLPETHLDPDLKEQVEYYSDQSQMNPIYVSTSIIVTELENPPDMKRFSSLPNNMNFSIWIPKHAKLATELTKIFLGAKDVDELLSLGLYAHSRCNPYLFVYALSVAILHRPDTKDLQLPGIMQIFPDYGIEGTEIKAIIASAKSSIKKDDIYYKMQMKTGSYLDSEHRLAYWREDLGMASHHYYWHLTYPHTGAKEIVDKDRRGELFYYCHQQFMARYNFERSCNHLNETVRFNQWHKPLSEGYFPKLTGAKAWPGRPANQVLHDLNQDEKVDISDLENWRDRILGSITSGNYRKDGKILRFEDAENGIDILGNIVESCDLSPDSKYYGDLHNSGHDMIASIHDPDSRYLEEVGVMGATATAQRDPVFYRWHAFIDHIFQQYKKTLKPYEKKQLEYKDITIKSVEVQCDVTTDGKPCLNKFYTFWATSIADISAGLTESEDKTIKIKYDHLQHDSFTYKIMVDNAGEERKGTCRIFMAPKYNNTATGLNLKHHRHRFIELDRFVVNLKPGCHQITRKSSESSVTVPFKRLVPETSKPAYSDSKCKCGWPDNLLIPKGTTGGFSSRLFVMISDIKDDKVNEDDPNDNFSGSTYCGMKSKRYPDKRAMGFPFDRPPNSTVTTVDNFVSGYGNMKLIDVTINFDHNRPKEVI